MNNRTKLLAACAALTVAGCGAPDNSEQAREAQMEKLASQYGVDVDVDVQIDPETGEETVSLENLGGVSGARVGTNLDLPDGFPDDIALPPGVKIISVSPLPNGYAINSQSDAPAAQMQAFFETQMQAAGWSLESGTSPGGGMSALRFAKGQRVASVTLMPGGGKTTVQVSTMQLPQ